MTKKYDKVVFIMRGQIIHRAHEEIIKMAFDTAEKVYIIFGSADRPMSIRNPFSVDQRQSMIDSFLDRIDPSGRIYVCAVRDNIYDSDAWARDVEKIVKKTPEQKVAIIGHKKDATTFYLDMFPEWDFVEVGDLGNIDSTKIRETYFNKNYDRRWLEGVVSKDVLDWLDVYRTTEPFNEYMKLKDFITKYREPYAGLPYEQTFVTADAVVVCQNRVLLVKRKAFPGKGLYALPGGFLDAKTDSSLLEAAVRELYEETRIKVAEKDLRSSLRLSKVFDNINRSDRGRTITEAHLFKLSSNELPKTRASSDASSVKWVPLSSIDSNNMFEDHYDIIKYFTSVE